MHLPILKGYLDSIKGETSCGLEELCNLLGTNFCKILNLSGFGTQSFLSTHISKSVHFFLISYAVDVFRLTSALECKGSVVEITSS